LKDFVDKAVRLCVLQRAK